MAFLKQSNVCDNSGDDLDDVETPVGDGNHEFCSTDCRDEYNEDHGHEDDEEEAVCEFC
ncbi:MAG: hypothetical protein SVW02_02085 [Candidatus Nanohaloarchaea archaeon]|nr:hypothetical protein [Candidatus Nanohaloarchaea archaeon]